MSMYRRYLPQELFERVRIDLEEAVMKAESVVLPQDLQFIREFYKACLKALDGKVMTSDYIDLAKLYKELWLSERKPQGLEDVIGKFWRAAGLVEIEENILKYS